MFGTAQRISALAVACLVGFGGVGCGQSFVSNAGPTGEGGDQTDVAGGDGMLLVPAGGTSHTVGVHAEASLRVLLLEKGSGDAVEGSTVEFEITDGADGGSLSAESAVTDGQGAAAVDFRADGSAGSVDVAARHPAVEADVSFQIQIQSVPTGGLRVDLVNAGESVMSLKDIEVRAYRTEDLACDRFDPLADDQPDTGDRASAPAAGQTVSFSDLDVRKPYTVTAVARGDRGQIAAGGCDQKIGLTDDQVTEKELLLHLVPLQPAGTYDVTAEWDFSEAVSESGAVGKNVVRVLDIFDNPGEALYREVINLVENFISGLAGKTIDWVLKKTGLDQQLKDIINQSIQQNEALCKVREAGRDLRDVLANLTVHSELTIGNLQSNYQFRGRNNWVGITIYWRGMCSDAYADACSGGRDKNDTDARKKACAAIDLKADADGEIGSLGVLSSKWTGRVSAYNQLQIDKHPLPLKYGEFVKYVLNQIILPELTNGNANSLSGAFSHWVGCGNIASSVTGSNGKVCAPQPVNQCITDKDVEGFCTSAIGTLFGAADLVIGELEYETGIEVGGEATMVETTSDGRVDRLEDGTYSGHVSVKGGGNKTQGGQSNIEATWEGQRKTSGNGN